MTNSNAYSSKKVIGNNKQASAQTGLFWSPCLNNKDRKCPYGYHVFLEGHGKVFDADLNLQVAGGCKGGDNRVLCVPNSLILDRCNWYRDAKGVSLPRSG